MMMMMLMMMMAPVTKMLVAKRATMTGRSVSGSRGPADAAVAAAAPIRIPFRIPFQIPILCAMSSPGPSRRRCPVPVGWTAARRRRAGYADR
jgi:hypothetical protein